MTKRLEERQFVVVEPPLEPPQVRVEVRTEPLDKEPPGILVEVRTELFQRGVGVTGSVSANYGAVSSEYLSRFPTVP